MAELWKWREPATVEDTVVPHEPSAMERVVSQELRTSWIDAALRVELTLSERHWPTIDGLLDARYAPEVQPLPLRPSVPVIPGRPS